MYLLKNKIYLFCLGFIIICSCNRPIKKENEPESEINRQADSLLIICLNILDTTSHKSQNNDPFKMPVFMKNYLAHELDSTIPLKPYCVINYQDKIEYNPARLLDSLYQTEFEIQFYEYNKDSVPKKIDSSTVHYFNYIEFDSIVTWEKIGKIDKLMGKYHISKPILSANKKFIYLEYTELLLCGWHCLFEKDSNGVWFLNKMEMTWIS